MTAPKALRFTYLEACQAMQAGVAGEAAIHGGLSPDQNPKHLRVGVNSALVNDGALAKLLIDKGLITEAEYLAAITAGMNAEVERYEQHLSEKTGHPCRLAPGGIVFGGGSPEGERS